MSIRIAQMIDVMAGERPRLWLARPRLTEPERRSRVIGYLATAPQVRPGWRSDGEWVWPQTLADQVRSHGGGPPGDMLEHIATHDYLLAAPVSPQRLALAAQAVDAGLVSDAGRSTGAGLVGDEGTLAEGWDLAGGRLCTTLGSAGRPAGSRPLIWAAEDGSRRLYFGPYGWQQLGRVAGWPAELRGGATLVELPVRQAVEIADHRVAGQFDEFLSRDLESATDGQAAAAALRFARVFDGQTTDHRAWFTPCRVRIGEAERRRRLAAYLSGAELVVRVTSRTTDPLDPAAAAVVPLSFRTDGVWVWQEALSHYVLTRGIAPELGLLCHIEERGYQLPESPPGEVVRAAAQAVRGGPPPRPARPDFAYVLRSRHGAGREIEDEPVLMRHLRGGGVVEAFTRDLRWHRMVEGPQLLDGSITQISQAQAIGIVDQMWANQVGCGPHRSFRPWELAMITARVHP